MCIYITVLDEGGQLANCPLIWGTNPRGSVDKINGIKGFKTQIGRIWELFERIESLRVLLAVYLVVDHWCAFEYRKWTREHLSWCQLLMSSAWLCHVAKTFAFSVMKVKDDEEMRGCKHSNLHQLQLDSLISNPFTHGTDLVPFDTSHKMTYICRRSYSSNSKPPSPHVGTPDESWPPGTSSLICTFRSWYTRTSVAPL